MGANYRRVKLLAKVSSESDQMGSGWGFSVR